MGASIDRQFQSFRQAFEKAEGIRTGTESFRNEVYDTEKVTVDGTILKFLYSQTEGELKYLVLGEDIFDVLLLEYKSFDDWFVIPSDYKKKGVLEMAGHSERCMEPCFSTIQEIASDALRQIKRDLERTDEYCLLGYSMGALVCYERYYMLKNTVGRLPSICS